MTINHFAVYTDDFYCEGISFKNSGINTVV